MTERRPIPASASGAHADGRAAARPSAPRRPRFLPTILAAVAAFLVLFEFLAFQLRSGNDPALGASQPVASVHRPRPVLDRKVIRTRVVQLPPRSEALASGATAPATTAASATTGAAPAPSAPAVPAPAPAPAAPVTSSS